MSQIDLYITAEEAMKEDKPAGFSPLPEGVYDFVITDVQMSQTSKGRPRLSVRASVINNPVFNGRTVFYSCPLPWKPNGGEIDTSGIGFIIALFKGIGMKWQGTGFNTEDLIGAAFKAKVEIRQRMRDGVPVDGVFDNQITKIIPAV